MNLIIKLINKNIFYKKYNPQYNPQWNHTKKKLFYIMIMEITK